MDKLYALWNHTLWHGDGDDFCYNIASESQQFTSFWEPKTPAQLKPVMVVLQGPAGMGKTTLAKKWMLSWMQGNFPGTHHSSFYLSCKQLNHQGACTFAELISKLGPEVQEAEMQAQGQKVLFVIDGFDELRVPSGSFFQDLCGNWKKQKPVPVLLGSLLKRNLLPNATLLVTTRSRALRELRRLVHEPISVEVEGLSEPGRRRYFLKHFKEEFRAQCALEAMKSNPALFRMAAAPAVCQIVCACLSRQMEEGQDPAATCRTSTSLFLRFLCGQFEPAMTHNHYGHLPAALRAVCLLAAQGMWAQTSVLDQEDLQGLGLTEADLRPFLDKNILQEDTDCGRCYAFVHLSVQQFLAAVFYVLDGGVYGDRGGCRWDIGDVQALLSEEERLKNPDLTLVGYFLFGLVNEQRARELETTFGCRVSAGVKQELLASLSFCSAGDTREALRRLYESQEEPLVKEAMVQAREVSVHLRDELDLLHASFCLRQAQNLQKMSLRVGRGVFLEEASASEIPTQVERWQHDHHVLRLWTDLCSVFSSNKNLIFLDVSENFLSPSSVRILCEQITCLTCCLQEVVIKDVSPNEAYREFCMAFIGKETLTHVTLEGIIHNDKVIPVLLCEALQHRMCNLKCLRLGACSDVIQQWDDFPMALVINQSLQFLDLTASDLSDEGVKMLCEPLRHPKCPLQRLSLENCQLTGACCKELSSALVSNQRLTHLCLAENDIGDSGVQLLCKGLSYPYCQLQTLVLYQCGITRRGCEQISKVLHGGSSLRCLDLGLNPITTGLSFLCEALEQPHCNITHLGLCGCSIPPFCCEYLASVLAHNQKLEALDLGQNLLGQDGMVALLEALKQSCCPLKTLRLKTDEPSVEIQTLLQELKDSNPELTIDRQSPTVIGFSYCDPLFWAP